MASAILASASAKPYPESVEDRIAYTTALVTPVVEHWLELEIAQWVHSMKDRPDDPSHHERMLLPRSYISLLGSTMKDRSDDPLHHERTLLPRSNISLLRSTMKDRSDDPFIHSLQVERDVALW